MNQCNGCSLCTSFPWIWEYMAYSCGKDAQSATLRWKKRRSIQNNCTWCNRNIGRARFVCVIFRTKSLTASQPHAHLYGFSYKTISEPARPRPYIRFFRQNLFNGTGCIEFHTTPNDSTNSGNHLDGRFFHSSHALPAQFFSMQRQ